MPIKKKIHFIIFLLFPCFSFCQLNRPADSSYVFSLIDTAEQYFTGSRYDSAIFYCDKAEQFSKAKNYKKGLAYALIEKTDVLIDKDDLDKAGLFPPQTYTIGQQLRDSLVMAIADMQTAQTRMYGGKLDEAVSYFEKCTRYFNKHPSKYAALAYNDFGYTWGQKEEPQKQADCLIKALEIYDQLKDPDNAEIAVTLNNLSTLYYSLGQKEKAVEYGEQSIVYRKKAGDIVKLSLGCCNLSQIYLGVDNEKAVQYQQLCVKYAEQSGDEMRIMHSYITSSLIASALKDSTGKSLEYELKAIAILEKNKKNPVMLARRYIAVGMYYARTQADSLQAISYFKKSVDLSEKTNNRTNLRDVYYQLSVFYKVHNNFSDAYSNYSRYILYRDSLVNENTQTNIAELETKYQTEKKDNEISRLNADQRIKELQIEKQNALIAGNRIEAEKKQKEIELLSQAKELQDLKIRQQDEQLERQLLVAKNNEQQLQLAEKEKLLQQRQLKNSETTRNFILAGAALLALLGYVLFNRYQLKRKVQEQEALLVVRNNIAKDLHDEIGSTLTSIRILSEVSGKNLSKDQLRTSAFLQKITEQSAAAQQGISDIVWAVKPENDKLENMLVRMREYVSQTLESKNIHTVINIDEQVLSKTLDMNQRRDFLLVFKEAINNIAKYAEATEVQIHLRKNNGNLCLQVIDNGKGFDTAKQTSSSGLKNMRARATSLGGTLEIYSVIGEGSKVNLSVPAT